MLLLLISRFLIGAFRYCWQEGFVFHCVKETKGMRQIAGLLILDDSLRDCSYEEVVRFER